MLAVINEAYHLFLSLTTAQNHSFIDIFFYQINMTIFTHLIGASIVWNLHRK